MTTDELLRNEHIRASIKAVDVTVNCWELAWALWDAPTLDQLQAVTDLVADHIQAELSRALPDVIVEVWRNYDIPGEEN